MPYALFEIEIDEEDKEPMELQIDVGREGFLEINEAFREMARLCQEKEMARLCLTGRNGTTILGLYRGLSLKLKEKNYHPRFRNLTLADLKETRPPLLLQVGLQEGLSPEVQQRLERSWGQEERHLVVFLGFAKDGRVKIGDPRLGFERWPREDFLGLWGGWAVVLR